MGLARVSSSDPQRSILIEMLTLEEDDGTPADPVRLALPVQAAFPAVGISPQTADWRAADWVEAVSGGFRVRCQIGAQATGVLAPGRYQPYVRVVLGTDTITSPAADILESY